MNHSHFSLARAGILSVIVFAIFITCWEFYWRSRGYSISYNNDEALWTDKRQKVYLPSDKATVFIGSSRIKFDLDIPTWEKESGEKAIQLAIEGTSPRPVLENLANDENFKGKLIVDVTEDLFFSPSGMRPDIAANNAINYYKKVSPTQLFGFQVNHVLESQFVFLEKENFSITALLNDLHVPNRPGVFDMPIFPKKFVIGDFDRQTIMTDEFVSDTSLQNKVKTIWTIYGAYSKERGVGGDTLKTIMTQIKTAVDKIKARGGKVIFVRTPSSEPAYSGEITRYPPKLYWERMLAETGCKGINFVDYPTIAHFTCPEWSHLKPKDGKIFTKELAHILQHEKSWVSYKK